MCQGAYLALKLYQNIETVANKETKVRSLTTEKRMLPEMVVAHFLDSPLFSQQSIHHSKCADQTCREANGYGKMCANNVCQWEGNRKTQGAAILSHTQLSHSE